MTRIFDAEFVIGHKGNTEPKWPGVALSFVAAPKNMYVMVGIKTKKDERKIHPLVFPYLYYIS